MNAINQSSADFEAQYKTLFDYSNDGIILHEPTGQILKINLKALNLFGYSEAEATQLNIQQLHPAEAMAACKAAFQTVIEEGEAAFETLFRRRDGSIFPAEVSAKRFQINNRSVVQGIIRDITERKISERTLQQQLKKERLTSVIAAKVRESLDLQECLQTTVNEVQQFLDTDRVLIYQFNADWSGFVPVEAKNHHCESVFQKTIHDPCFGEGYLELYQQGRISKVDDIYTVGYKHCYLEFLEALQVRAVLCVPILRNQKLWGLLIAHHCQASRHWQSLEVDLLGQLATQVAIATQQAELYHQIQTELNQRKKVEATLRQSETAIRRLYEIIATSETTLTHTLEKLLALGCEQFSLELGMITQLTKEQLTIVASYTESNPPLQGIRFPLDQTYCQKTLQSKGQQPFTILSACHSPWNSHPGHTQFKVEAYLGIPLWVNGCPYGTLNFSSQTPRTQEFSSVEIEFLRLMAQWIGGALERDCAAQELAKTRDHALAATRTKSDFLATMSHEIHPMNAIIGMTGLLLDTHLSNEQQDFIETIRQGSESLLTIINDILDFSKIESGQFTLEEQPFSLPDCIADVYELLKAAASKKHLPLTVHIANNVPKIIISDITRIRQVLVNLIGNAIKFTDKGFIQINVTAQAEDKTYEIQFAVQDTGIGIPTHQRHNLFKPFSQLDSSTARKYEGTGLGLVICQKLAQLMNGRIWFNSEIGQGSTFYFTVRAAATTSKTPQTLGKQRDNLVDPIDHHLAERLPLRILLAEDNHVNQKLAIQLLGRMGYRIDVAGNGLEVLASLERQIYDVILMDVQMPEMDGLTATQKIHAIWQQQSPRIIAMTANAMAGDREKFLAAGMDDYISKPIHFRELIQALERCPINEERELTFLAIEDIKTTTSSPLEPVPIINDQAGLPHLDKTVLERTLAPLGGITADNLKPFFDVYVNESQQLFQTIQAAIAEQKCEQIEYAAHTLKSSSGALGMVAVQHICQHLENESRNGNGYLEQYIPQLKTALAEGIKLLEAIT